MKIEKKKIKIKRNKVLKPAQIVEQSDGTRVYHDPIIKEIEEEKKIYCIDDGVDVHEFSTEKAAKAFLRGSK